MQDARVVRDLHVQGSARLEPMFPVHLEAKEVHVEFSGPGFVEDSKDRCRLSKTHAPTSRHRAIAADSEVCMLAGASADDRRHGRDGSADEPLCAASLR